MPRGKAKHTPFTKEDVKKVIGLWDTHATKDIAKEIGRKTCSVTYIANALKKEGYLLPKKSVRYRFNILIKEVVSELSLSKR